MACIECDDTLIIEGAGINVTGSGTSENPYVISSDLPDFAQSLTVRDTSTVNLSLLGSGTTEDPFLLRADAAVSVQGLTDVIDAGGPSVGDTIIWTGVGDAGHFEFAPPPTAAAGAVNAGVGLGGNGTSGTPLVVKVSGTWGSGDLAGLGSDANIGLEIYIDADGNLRAQPVGAGGTVTWASITGKPTTFAPSPHTHSAADITDQANINAGRINDRKITVTATSSTPPASPAALDLWFFPKGA